MTLNVFLLSCKWRTDTSSKANGSTAKVPSQSTKWRKSKWTKKQGWIIIKLTHQSLSTVAQKWTPEPGIQWSRSSTQPNLHHQCVVVATTSTSSTLHRSTLTSRITGNRLRTTTTRNKIWWIRIIKSSSTLRNLEICTTSISKTITKMVVTDRNNLIKGIIQVLQIKINITL